MTLIETFSIKENADIIYTKQMLQNHFDDTKFIDKSFFLFAFMELATNLIKHTNGGTVFLFESLGYYLLGVGDNGTGIQNVTSSLKKGFSTANNSLGLGLYQLHTNEVYDFEIFSTTQKHFHGTTILLKPKQIYSNITAVSDPFINEKNNGDFFAKKGKFLLFGDAAGHNKKAHTTAQFITKKFFSTPLSCILIDKFFLSLHQELQDNAMRGAVCIVGEIVKNHLTICGVGDLSLWIKTPKTMQRKKLKSGIIGEIFSDFQQYDFMLNKEEFCIITTDGIEENKMKDFKAITMQNYSTHFIAFTMLYFAGSIFDDSSILIIKGTDDG